LWSLTKPFLGRNHHLGHGLSRVLSLMPPHTLATKRSSIEQLLVSAIRRTTKFCGCGKSHVDYLGHCCQTTILHCTACCAVLCKLKLSLKCVLSGCTVTSHPPCRIAHANRKYHSVLICAGVTSGFAGVKSGSPRM
jgi:hypothetical protein